MSFLLFYPTAVMLMMRIILGDFSFLMSKNFQLISRYVWFKCSGSICLNFKFEKLPRHFQILR